MLWDITDMLLFPRITNMTPCKTGLAKANGAAASLSCLARSIGPLMTGKLFAFGVATRHLEAPFWALGGVALIGAAQSLFFRTS